MTTFTDRNATKDARSRADEDALLLFYPIKEDKLDKLRHSMYYRKCATSLKAVEATELPPTSAVFLYHSFRVYYQVQCWKEDHHHLVPTDWGWK